MKRNHLACGALLLGCALGVARQGVAQEPPSPPSPWVTKIEAPQYFAVLVADAEKSAQWYRQAFGLREVERSSAEDGSWQIINLTNDQLFVEVIRDNKAEKGSGERGFFKVGFHVPDVALVADAVGRATGERPRVLDFPRQGIRIVQIRDPDGNTLQLLSRLER